MKKKDRKFLKKLLVGLLLAAVTVAIAAVVRVVGQG